jgi:transcriptional regulator with XRE-family HTH domain
VLSSLANAFKVGNIPTACFKASFFMKPILLAKLAHTRIFCVDAKKTSHHHRRMTIHDRIKERRIALGFESHGALAAEVGVSWQTVQQWENGTSAPTRKRMTKVAEALKTTPNWLMYGDQPEGRKVLQFAELSGLEAQLVMLYRQLDDDEKHGLSVYANQLVNKSHPDKRSAANPFPGTERRAGENDRRHGDGDHLDTGVDKNSAKNMNSEAPGNKKRG